MRSNIWILPLLASVLTSCRLSQRLPTALMLYEPCSLVRGPSPFHEVTISNRTCDDGSTATDYFVLRARTAEGQEGELEFESSYGMFEARIIPALAAGEALLCLRTGAGRGTNVRSEWVTFYRFIRGKFSAVLDFEVGGWEPDPICQTSHYAQRRWELADLDGDGMAEVIASPDGPNPWLNGAVVYRWTDSRGQFERQGERGENAAVLDPSWNPPLDQVADQLQEILDAGGPPNFVAANLGWVRDAQMLIAYVRLWQTLEGPQRPELLREQEAWKKKTAEAMRLAASEYEGGTLASLLESKTYARLARERTQELQRRLDTLQKSR